MRSKKTKLVALAAAAVAATATIATGAAYNADDDYSATLASKIDPSVPKNVILLIGDGMGDSEVTSGRYYGKGANGRLNMDKLPFRGSSVHYVLTPGPGPTYAPNYTGDSAPTAVAWSTGKKTIDGRLAQGPSTAANVPGSNAGYETYMEIAKAKGKSTGNVSTAEITDATPAGPSAHISQRACQGPADTRTTCPSEAKTATPAGLGSVAEQEVDTNYDVILGGGRDRFTQKLVDGGSDTVLDYATTKGYTQQPTDKAGLAGITSLSGGKVLGLFNASNMTTEFKPLYARTDAYLTANAATLDPKVNGGSTTTRCDETQRSSTNEPSLADMTKKAISLLQDNPKGFTLQVEGASIDKRDHAADVCGQIGELLAFDDAIGVAQAFQKQHPDTLIIVSADHAHSSQIVSATTKPATGAAYATVQTIDGAPLRVVYGTADTGNGATTSGSQSHTGAEVPLWASGPQASNIQGTLDQTEIFAVLNGKTPSKLATGENGKDGVDGTNGVDGAVGTPGLNGAAGAPGAAGAAGAAGPAGAAGTPGSNGVNGTNGAAGVNGTNGTNGSNGRDAQVSCKVQGSKTVKCTVSYSGGALSKATAARLVKSGKTVARGTVSTSGKLTLKASKRLAKGTYTLVAGGQTVKLKLG
ncbi:MAG: alkaline phosphatase [Solirubrobacteraceae bacterium]